jgi:hypothetical protein
MKRLGVSQMMTLTVGKPSRSVIVSVDERRQPKYMMVMMGRPIPPTKSENESLTAFFSASGEIVRGSRLYFTAGTPARMSEDRHGGLLPADTGKIVSLAKAVIARCGA